MYKPALLNFVELLLHHHNMTLALGREAAAKGQGLVDPYRYAHPYPGSTNLTVIAGDKVMEQATPVEGKPAKPAVRQWWSGPLAILLGMALGCLLLVTLWFISSVKPAATPDADPNLSYEVWERVGNGEWQKSKLSVDQLLKGKK